MTTFKSPYEVANRLVRAQLERDALDAEITYLKDHFRQAQSTQLTSEDGPAIDVKVSPNKRIDDKLARENLDPDTYAQVSKVVIDTAKARAFLTGDQLASITKEYDNKVEVKLV